jgi:hypothetical protein
MPEYPTKEQVEQLIWALQALGVAVIRQFSNLEGAPADLRLTLEAILEAHHKEHRLTRAVIERWLAALPPAPEPPSSPARRSKPKARLRLLSKKAKDD